MKTPLSETVIIAVPQAPPPFAPAISSTGRAGGSVPSLAPAFVQSEPPGLGGGRWEELQLERLGQWPRRVARAESERDRKRRAESGKTTGGPLDMGNEAKSMKSTGFGKLFKSFSNPVLFSWSWLCDCLTDCERESPRSPADRRIAKSIHIRTTSDYMLTTFIYSY